MGIEFPETNILPPGNFELFSDGMTQLIYPDNPLVKAREGFEVRLDSPNVPVHPHNKTEWEGWLQHEAKTIWAAYVLFAGGAIPDNVWQSFIGQLRGSPKDHLVTEVVGRNLTGESWAQTLPLPTGEYDHRGSRVPASQAEKYKAVFERFYGRFAKNKLVDINLLPEGLKIFDLDSEDFQKRSQEYQQKDFPWQEDLLVATDQFDIVAVLHPHLQSGIHLVVHARNLPQPSDVHGPKIPRPWCQLEQSLVVLAASEMVSQVLEETEFEGNPIAAWSSIRATGSWFGGFEQLRNRQAFENVMNGKASWNQLKHWMRGVENPNSDVPPSVKNFHPHIYGSDSPDEDIVLARRPKNEIEFVNDYEGFKTMSEPLRESLRRELNHRMKETFTPFIQGNIAPKALVLVQ